MRARAVVLRSKAELLAAAAQQLRARTEATEFEGPTAVRFREAMYERTRLLDGLAVELYELADSLLRTAAWSEEQLLASSWGASPGGSWT
jgi:hypothetical protein